MSQATKPHRHDKKWYTTYSALVARIRKRDARLAKDIRQYRRKWGVHAAQDMLDILVRAGLDDGK